MAGSSSHITDPDRISCCLSFAFPCFCSTLLGYANGSAELYEKQRHGDEKRRSCIVGRKNRIRSEQGPSAVITANNQYLEKDVAYAVRFRPAPACSDRQLQLIQRARVRSRRAEYFERCKGEDHFQQRALPSVRLSFSEIALARPPI